MCDRFGYGWEAHEVETEDGWFVTVFRITQANGQDLTKSDKPPILLQHGSAQSAFEWLGYSPLGPTLAGQLAERGYDVWVANSRGKLYSNTNRNAATETLAEHWDFSAREMALYDTPAFVTKVLETTGKPKLTLMAFSHGGLVFYLALAQAQEWYAERVHRYVALSACAYPRQQNQDYEENVL